MPHKAELETSALNSYFNNN